MIFVKNVNFAYKKNQPILSDVSFTLSDGVTVLIGENGSGKTTLIKILTTVLPTTGKIMANDVSIQQQEYKRMIAYLPQEFDVYPNLKVRDILSFVASLKSIDSTKVKAEVDKALSQVNASSYADKVFKKCSSGMKRRIGIASALIGEPQIVILDEPTAGVDPKERISFYRTIKDCFVGKTVLISTHILDDIELLADNVIMLSNAEIVYSGSYREFYHALDEQLFQLQLTSLDSLNGIDKRLILTSYKKDGFVVLKLVGALAEMPTGVVSVQPTTEDIWLYFQKGVINNVE
jgi:ABC-2 type transport system ATP-binding protein